MTQSVLHDLEGPVPGNFFKFTLAAVTTLLSQQWLGDPGRGILLHDAGRTLGTDHTLIQRVIRITLDITDLAVPQGDTDTTAAGAHITGRIFDLYVAFFIQLF